MIRDQLQIENHSTINLQYGKLGCKLAEFLNVTNQLPIAESRGKPECWAALSIGKQTPTGFWWTLYPNFVTALENVGVVETFLSTDEVQYSAPIIEGRFKRVNVNVYERDVRARRKCLAFYGTRCAVCDIDFGEVYGEVGEGYIHVHHLQPLAAVSDEHVVDPVVDLRPVCPNCHAIIHRKSPPYTIKEVKAMLRKT